MGKRSSWKRQKAAFETFRWLAITFYTFDIWDIYGTATENADARCFWRADEV